MHKSADVWSGLALAALGAYIIAHAWQWEYLGPDGPGPGFFPLSCGIAMLVLSAALVVTSALRAPSADTSRVDWHAIGRALATWAAFAASIAVLKPLGFTSSLALLTFFIVAVMYRRPPAMAAMVAVASGGIFYLVFPLALGLAVPIGPLGF